jgi:hypothetical protein
MKVAELLFKNGFKEAYAIKGGVRGQQGWMVCPFSSLMPVIFYQNALNSLLHSIRIFLRI